MLKSYLKIAYRNLLKNRVFSLINILGLAIGMAACILILQYVSFELSYDNFHKHADRIYRVALDKYQGDNEKISFATNFNALPKSIKNNVPEIETVSMFHRPASGIFIITNQQGHEVRQFQEDHLLYADEYFFTLFTYIWIAGDPTSALLNPYSVVLTKSAAEKYFGPEVLSENILGQNLQVSFFSRDVLHTVTGIIEDIPTNTHLSFNILLSSSTFSALYPEDNFEESWEWYDTYVYALAQPGISPARLTTQLQSLLEANSEAMGEGPQAKSKIVIQPLTDIHLHSHRQMEAESNGNYQHVVFLIIIAFALLVVAGLNYVNMHTAQSLRRIREVGIRKYAGAGSSQVGIQALTETGLTLVLAMLITFTIVQLVLPRLQISLDFSANLFSPFFIFFSFLAFGMLLILLGSYPTYFMASFEPISAIRGKYTGQKRFHLLQRGLVGFQLLVVLLTNIFTFMLYQQYQFMQNQYLGFDDQVLVFSAPTVQTVRGTEAYATRVRTFKDALTASSAIGSVSASTHVPGKPIEYATSQIYAEGQDVRQGIDMNFVGIDSDYIETFELQILAGENFPQKPKPNTSPYILNEAAAQALGFTNPEAAVGQYVIHQGSRHQIQAVINDYHQKSLKEPIVPLAFVNYPAHHEYFSVKVASNNIPGVIHDLSALFIKHFPNNPFTYYFLDEAFSQLYQNERQYSAFFNVLSALIIIVACLGLFSITTFSTQQRTKEVGIRKVLGASAAGIVMLLSKDLIGLVLVAGVIALPLAYFGMKQWLTNYAFRITIHWWMFMLPLVIVLLIALITVGFHTVKAALANPTDSLRYE